MQLLMPMPREAAAARHAPRLLVLDEKGRTLERSRYIRVSRGRVLVPIRVFEHERLGLWVRRDFRYRMADLAMPESDYVIRFHANRRAVEEPSQHLGGASRFYWFDHPAALLRRGDFYVSMAAVEDRYPGNVLIRWNNVTKTLTLQRSPIHERMLEIERKQGLRRSNGPRGYR